MDQLFSIAQLFNGSRIFRIPDYQRGYAWRANIEVAAFWNDLNNLEVDRKHYTGMVTLKEVPDDIVNKNWQNELWLIKAGYTPEHIVDGQQRLTTTIILIQAICDFYNKLYPKDKDENIFIGDFDLKQVKEKYIVKKNTRQIINSYIFGYETDNPSFDFLKNRIFHEPISTKGTETFYTLNIENAYEFFKNNLIQLHKNEGEEGVAILFTKLTQNFLFNLFEIGKDYAGFDVFAAFETMNNRGKRLSNLELLKNRLIYLTTLYPSNKIDEVNKTALRTIINDAWKVVYEQLGHNKMHPLNDDEFLFAHWVMYYKYSRTSGNEYVDFLLNKQFAISRLQSKEAKLSGIKAVEELIDIDEFDEIISIDEDYDEETILNPKEIKDYVISLKESSEKWYATWFPNDSAVNLTEDERLWIDRLNRIGITFFRPLVTAALLRDDVDASEKVELFKTIERYIFVVFRCQSAKSNYGSSEFYRQARQLYKGETTIVNVIGVLRNYYQYTLSSIDDGTNNEYFDHTYLCKAIKKNFDIYGTGYYGWGCLRYFLFEYECFLAEKGKHRKKLISWENFIKPPKTKISIEHILPQTPTNQYWKHRFGKMKEKELSYYQGSIGNLLLLDQSINSSLQNDSFPDKKNVKKEKGRIVRHGYSNGSYSEVEVSLEKDWDKNAILLRGMKILEFMEERWELKFKSKEIMEETLFLDKKTLKQSNK